MTCRWDRGARQHLTAEHLPDCTTVACLGCQPCATDDDGNPTRHCRARTRCTSHLDWTEHACPRCVGKVRDGLTAVVDLMTLMPDEAAEQGIDSEPANLAGPHADYVTAQWRLVNADRAGQIVEELDLRDPYTCLTMHERAVREHLGHDGDVLVSSSIERSADYLAWALTDLARDEDGALLLASLLGDLRVLVVHMEAALRDARTPERGAPCPTCVGAERGAPRLVRVYGHWCLKPDCARVHYLDDTADRWVCPADSDHWWDMADYRRWVYADARAV